MLADKKIKPVTANVRLSFSFPERCQDDLRSAARRKGMSVSEYVRLVVVTQLDEESRVFLSEVL